MIEESERSPRSELFRTTIAAFIEARREAKLKGKEDDADTASKYDYTAWPSMCGSPVSQDPGSHPCAQGHPP